MINDNMIYVVSSIVLCAIVFTVYIQTLHFRINSLRRELERTDWENRQNMERINELENRLDDIHHEILNNVDRGMNLLVEENGEQAINNVAEFFQLNETNQHL